MSVAEPLPLWRRSLERSEKAFETLSGAKVAAVAIKQGPSAVPASELEFVASRVLESPVPDASILEPLSGPECSPWPSPAGASVAIFLASDPTATTAQAEFDAVAGRGRRGSGSCSAG